MPVVSAISTIGCPTPVKILSQQETINSENYAFKPEINSFVKAKPVFWRLLALMAWNHIYILLCYLMISNACNCSYFFSRMVLMNAIIGIHVRSMFIYIYNHRQKMTIHVVYFTYRAVPNLCSQIRHSLHEGSKVLKATRIFILPLGGPHKRTDSPWKVTKEGGGFHTRYHINF